MTAPAATAGTAELGTQLPASGLVLLGTRPETFRPGTGRRGGWPACPNDFTGAVSIPSRVADDARASVLANGGGSNGSVFEVACRDGRLTRLFPATPNRKACAPEAGAPCAS